MSIKSNFRAFFVIACLLFSTETKSQPIELTWNLNWVNPLQHLLGLDAIHTFPDWVKSDHIGPPVHLMSDDHQWMISTTQNRMMRLNESFDIEFEQELHAGLAYQQIDTGIHSWSFSRDSNTMALTVEEDRLTSIYMRKLEPNGRYGQSKKVYTHPLGNRIWTVRCADNGAIVWVQDLPMGMAVYYMQDPWNGSQPIELLRVSSLLYYTLLLSPDGKWVWCRVSDSGFDLAPGVGNVTLYCHLENGSWTPPAPVRVDGSVFHGVPNDCSYDGSILQIGRRVVEWTGAGYKTRFEFTIPGYDYFGPKMADDGNSVVFGSQLLPVDPPIRRSSYQALVLSAYDESNPIQPVKTHIIDEGYMFNYNYNKAGTRLIWVKQEEDPFRHMVDISDWKLR